RAHAHLAEFQKVKITALDYARNIMEIDPRNAYLYLKKAADNIFERQFSVKEKVGNSERITRFRWVSSATYAKDEGFIELSFTPEVYPHLHTLKNQYTTYKLKNAASLKSVYSWRLYEYAKSWTTYCQEGKSVHVTLENLKHILEWPDTYDWSDAKKRALVPAIKEIGTLSNLDITYKIVKKGRSVHALEFKFVERDQLELDV
ncbi:replication initiator protein, partial [Vibrio sp. ES.051]|uniref:replication initiation protein n=1 Tax=Vibrio sp. ES.051 TaxID=1761909 RepID=UPI000BF4C5C7